MYLFRKLFNPEIYQGKYKKSNYFEGWYFKLIDRSRKNQLAIIPSISKDKEGRTNVLIQLLGNDNRTEYIHFNEKDFRYSENLFKIYIKDNYFSRNSIHLNIKGGQYQIRGRLRFTNVKSLPKSLYIPGIMGPFSYLPFMECNHGIVNIHHDIIGFLMINGKKVDFTGGYGYIEKDWGKSFPKTYIWFQSNHFRQDDATIMFALADIPFLGFNFPGFLCLLRHKDHICLFSTYTLARIRRFILEKVRLQILITDKKYKLMMEVDITEGGVLKAPQNGLMKRYVKESLKSKVRVRLSDHKGNIVFKGIGTNTGFELVKKPVQKC